MTTCTHPKTVWYKPNSGEKLRFTLPKQSELHLFEKIPLPCNRCDKCQLEYAKSWATRCAMEMAMHEQNTFITLTYENVDEVPTLKPKDMTKFIKRLRQHVAKNTPQEYIGHGDKHDPDNYQDKKIRYIQCGEYGTNTARPHHHAIIFGYDFPDQTFIGKTPKGHDKFNSEILDKLWGHGHCTVQTADIGAATYIAKYITKKLYGTKDLDGFYYCGGSNNTDYTKTDKETGEIHIIHKEYMTMSRMPGIGHEFFQKFTGDMFPKGTIHLRDSKNEVSSFVVPRYFYNKLAEQNPDLYIKSMDILRKRAIDNEERSTAESTPQRRKTKAYILKKAQVEKSRPYEGITPSHHVDMTDINHKIQSEEKYKETLIEQEQFEYKNRHSLQSKS